MDQPLYIGSDKLLGFTDTLSDWRRVVKNSQHQIVGYYNPTTNTTTDVIGNIFGYGNILSALLVIKNEEFKKFY